MGKQMVDILDDKQKGGQTSINKIQFRGFDQPFAQVVEVGGKELDNIAGLQN